MPVAYAFPYSNLQQIITPLDNYKTFSLPYFLSSSSQNVNCCCKIQMEQQSVEQWIQQAKQNRQYIVFYEGKVIDLTEFQMRHPGGKRALAPYVFTDITHTLFTIFKHQPEATLATLSKLVIGTVAVRKRVNTVSPRPSANKKKKVCFEEQSVEESKENSRSPVKGKAKTIIEKGSKMKEKSEEKPVSNLKDQKNKRFDVSIQILEGVEDDKYKDWGSGANIKKTKESVHSKKQQEILDEEKPIFRVRIMETKHMNYLSS